MIKDVTMPKLGESVTEGTISKWLVQPGDIVKKYEPIAEVITDKVNAEIPSSFTGKIKEIRVAEDEPVEVGVIICTMEVENIADVANDQSPPPEQADQVDEAMVTKDETQKNRYSPAVLRLSQEHNINLEQVTGSGKGGRITRKDLNRLIEEGAIPSSQQAEEEKTYEVQAVTPEQVVNTSASDLEIPVTGVRKVIADNMVKSKRETPHAWTMIEVDVTNLVNYRNEVKEDFKLREGYTLTYLPFFMKAIVESLKEFPQLNSLWAGDKIIQKKDINVSLAVATEDALYVPVIKHADEKSIKGLSRHIHELAQKVRTGKISSDDMQGGTFTINNTGSFGSVLSTPIINHPQAAILSIESIVKRPVVIESASGDMIAIRHMVNLCLSLDHRILDGLVCGRFLASVKGRLERMTKETTPIY